MNKLESASIEALGLSARSYGCLYRAGARTVHDVLEMTPDEIMALNGMGPVSLLEVMDALEAFVNAGKLTSKKGREINDA